MNRLVSTCNNMLVLREAIERHGTFPILYSDSDSKFKLIRYEGSCFFTYREETLAARYSLRSTEPF
ncbi:MAG: hypothetical protein ACUVTR_02465 [Dehalococcoidia bacterium]